MRVCCSSRGSGRGRARAREWRCSVRRRRRDAEFVPCDTLHSYTHALHPREAPPPPRLIHKQIPLVIHLTQIHLPIKRRLRIQNHVRVIRRRRVLHERLQQERIEIDRGERSGDAAVGGVVRRARARRRRTREGQRACRGGCRWTG